MYKEKHFSFFHKAGIKIDYQYISSWSDFKETLNGHIVLIKNILLYSDIEWLKNYPEFITIIFSEINHIKTYDLLEEIKKNKINQIEIFKGKFQSLNYLYNMDSVYIIPDDLSGSNDELSRLIPNVIQLHPISFNEFNNDALGKITLKKESFYSSSNKLINKQCNNIDIEKLESIDDKDINNIEINKESDNILQQNLLIRGIEEYFEEKYCIIRLQVNGAQIGRKTINLTKFYRKNNIASGRLKGNWSVFENTELKAIMDSQVLQHAIETVNNKFTISIPGYGRIIKRKDLDKYKEEIKNIIEDYIKYLKGESIKTIGAVKVKKQFNIKNEIQKSKEQLEKYLIGLEFEKKEKLKYQQIVKNYIYKNYYDIESFWKSVNYNCTTSIFTKEVWMDGTFVHKLLNVLYKEERYLWFDEEFINLLNRLMDNLYKMESR